MSRDELLMMSNVELIAEQRSVEEDLLSVRESLQVVYGYIRDFDMNFFPSYIQNDLERLDAAEDRLVKYLQEINVILYEIY